MVIMGEVKAICVSKKKGVVKTEIKQAKVREDWGIEEDAHAGHWHRQVSILPYEQIEAFKKNDVEIVNGIFGENLIISGIEDLINQSLIVGRRIQIGEVLLEVTQIGKDCHDHCEIYKRVGQCIMPKVGIFTRVIKGGTIEVGDEAHLLPFENNTPFTAAVITMSDKGSKGEREDQSGPAIVEILEKAGYNIVETMILPDEQSALQKTLIRLADQRQVSLIVTTGGTGFSKRDVTPEATLAVATRNAPGIAEAIRAGSMKITPRAMLSREASVIRNNTLIVNLPGSPKAVRESLDMVIDQLDHGLNILLGRDGECARK
ncbi:molybdenum cofactor synthesis domain-containing protein [Eubacterium oxidoreducens]|uniref:Molybdenum cofactor synthesis domain-containing protein n=2 Tax=Eubacterium oxidoreducens TaxID=1732 RepID=A0A1G6ADG0_EUBOX|nr:molybdenum cofactor synthesis domain-containing protein [Eubacterium oxidoreducens]